MIQNEQDKSVSDVVSNSLSSYLSVDDTELLGRQVVKGKQEPVVKVSLSTQRAVMDVCLLFVVLVSIEPAERHTQVYLVTRG